MASAPSDPRPVLGRVDRDCRLVAADPQLAALQVEAGSRVGASLALPQISAIARLALELRVPIERPAIAAGLQQDIEMWVRATPDEDGVALSLERWTVRPPAPPRLGALVAHEREAELGGETFEWAADEELRIVSLSSAFAEKLGVSPDEAVGQPLTRLFKLEEDEGGELPLLAAVAARADFTGQSARTRRDPNQILTLAGTLVEGGEGRFAGFQGEAVFENALVGSEAAPDADRLIDPALDETLRTPLDRIIESADRIVQQTDGPLRSDYADYATDIAAAARHLLSVIRSMSGETDSVYDQVNLAELAAEAGSLLEAAAEARQVAILIEPTGPFYALGEARGIIQILLNLIGNAVRHSPAGGAVALSLESSAGMVRVHVADNGPGIDPLDQQRIFERFEQGGSGEGGAGLGLAISRRLARSMGGDIRLTSAPGEGALFTLELPAA